MIHEKTRDPSGSRDQFDDLLNRDWKELFFDDCTGDWSDRWFLDGKKAVVSNSEKGMEFSAGPVFKDDACHGVLWAKEYTQGDLRIDYEYTRTDTENRCVNILYIQATGSGEDPYSKDITEWSSLREVPAMKAYFGHMNAFHVSYAAFTNTEEQDPGYIRARRYMASGLQGTGLQPDYDPGGLFGTGVPHRITAVKSGDHIYFCVDSPDDSLLCHWHNTGFPPITEGRIGLRHMFTRSARYRNFRISSA